MIKFAFYIFFALSFYLLVKRRWEFIFLIPVFNLIADMSFSFFEGLSEPTYLRGMVVLIFFVIIVKGFKTAPIYRKFYYFFFYLLILLAFSTEFKYSAKAVSQVIFSMGMFLAGYSYINSSEKYHRFIKGFGWFIVLAFLATMVGYLFGIGQELEYQNRAEDAAPEIVGLLGSGGLYAPGIALALLPILLKEKFTRYQKGFLLIVSLFLYIFIILTVRRTAILIPILGISGFVLMAEIRRKILKYLFVFGVIMVLIFPYFSSLFFQRYEIRKEEGRFEKEFYKTEERYLENLYMIESVRNFDDPMKILFGYGNNIFAEHIEDGQIVRRMLHSDTAKIFYGTGLTGLVLYFMIYIAILTRIIRLPSKGGYRELKAALIGLFLISLFVNFNGSITLITFRSVNFLLMGSILGYSNSIIKKDGRIFPG